MNKYFGFTNWNCFNECGARIREFGGNILINHLSWSLFLSWLGGNSPSRQRQAGLEVTPRLQLRTDKVWDYLWRALVSIFSLSVTAPGRRRRGRGLCRCRVIYQIMRSFLLSRSTEPNAGVIVFFAQPCLLVVIPGYVGPSKTKNEICCCGASIMFSRTGTYDKGKKASARNGTGCRWGGRTFLFHIYI